MQYTPEIIDWTLSEDGRALMTIQTSDGDIRLVEISPFTPQWTAMREYQMLTAARWDEVTKILLTAEGADVIRQIAEYEREVRSHVITLDEYALAQRSAA
jgi:hypothetical protein